jgi:hypothetical protein
MFEIYVEGVGNMILTMHMISILNKDKLFKMFKLRSDFFLLVDYFVDCKLVKM